MTNPGNTVRIRSRNGGRGSVYEANMWAQEWNTGVYSGNGVIQNSTPNMYVRVGGSSTCPDVVIAQNPAGYRIILDLVSQQTILITAPASNSRISSIVAYTDDLSVAAGATTPTGTPASCGLIVVNGTAAASPVAPNDSAIRAAITADGATGSQASYSVLSNLLIASTTTTITSGMTTAAAIKSTLIGTSIDTSTLASKAVSLATINGGATAGTLVTDASGNVSSASTWWTEIARTTLAVAGDTITVSGIPARKYLHIQFSTNATGGTTNIAMTFNSDTGSNYAVRAAANSNVADGTAINQSSIGVSAGGAVAQPQFGTLEVINVSSQEKYVIGEIVTAATGAGNVNERRALWAKWTNTSAQISTITFTNGSGTGDFAIGSEVIVLGHN